MKPTLVDSNILLVVATGDPTWADRSLQAPNAPPLVINALIYAEVPIGCRTSTWRTCRGFGLPYSDEGSAAVSDVLPDRGCHLKWVRRTDWH
jgi:hypothetical protein